MAPHHRGTPRVAEAVGDAPCARPQTQGSAFRRSHPSFREEQESAFLLVLDSGGCSDMLPPAKSPMEDVLHLP